MYIKLYTQNYIVLICVYTCTHKYYEKICLVGSKYLSCLHIDYLPATCTCT